MKNNWRRCLKLCADNYSDFDGNPAPVSEPQHERDREPDANAPREADDEVGPTAVPVEHISRKVLEGGMQQIDVERGLADQHQEKRLIPLNPV